MFDFTHTTKPTQFQTDLVETSKNFHGHERTASQLGCHQLAFGAQGVTNFANQSSQVHENHNVYAATSTNSSARLVALGSADRTGQQQPQRHTATGASISHLFDRDDKSPVHAGESISTNRFNALEGRSFTNPYFTDTESCVPYLASEMQTGNRTGGDQVHQHNSPLSSGAGGGLLKTAPSSDQMHFIENHIANLHNCQVTSSFKELSLLSKFSS